MVENYWEAGVGDLGCVWEKVGLGRDEGGVDEHFGSWLWVFWW